MFAKFLSTRTPAAASAPELQSGPSTQSASRRSPSLAKKLFSIKKAFRCSSSPTKNADSEGTSHRRQGAPALPQPSDVSEGLNALACDSAGFHPHSSLLPHVEPTDRPSRLAHRLGSKRNGKPQLRLLIIAQTSRQPPRLCLLRHRPSLRLLQRPSAPTRSSSNCPTQSAVPLLMTSLNAPAAYVAKIPATTSAAARTSSPRSTTSRSTLSPIISSPLAVPRSVAATPATTFSFVHHPSQCPSSVHPSSIN